MAAPSLRRAGSLHRNASSVPGAMEGEWWGLWGWGHWLWSCFTERGNTQGSPQKQQEMLAWVREWMPNCGYFRVNNVHCKKTLSKGWERGLQTHFGLIDSFQWLQLGDIIPPNSPQNQSAQQGSSRSAGPWPRDILYPREGTPRHTEPCPHGRRGCYSVVTLTLQELKPMHRIRWHLSMDLSASLHQGLNCVE